MWVLRPPPRHPLPVIARIQCCKVKMDRFYQTCSENDLKTKGKRGTCHLPRFFLCRMGVGGRHGKTCRDLPLGLSCSASGSATT